MRGGGIRLARRQGVADRRVLPPDHLNLTVRPRRCRKPPPRPAKQTDPSAGSASSPGPEQPGSTVTLSWSASVGATYYDLGIRDIATGAFVVDTTTTGTTYQANLEPNKTYRWNVAAGNASG